MSDTKQAWARNSVFYHMYPLGLCGAPFKNDIHAPRTPRLAKLSQWVDHMLSLGVNAVYIGPLFESSTHGYDTVDYFQVDRRLGNNETLKEFVAVLHSKGIKVILDAVLNHVGRDFWAFRKLLEDPHHSPYRDWFSGINHNARSPHGDPFTYDTWNGHYELVKLNLLHPGVKEHLLSAVKSWIETFDIDGLRLDAADCLHHDFLKELSGFCKKQKHDFWLLGEVIHGDYRTWINSGLDSVTNYECYKGLYSSLNDKNYFEIAYALNRQFGDHGLYKNIPLYNFADNHDVNRVASTLKDSAHLFPLYALLFTMPGVPSIYYGSEWGMRGQKGNGNDLPLRPCLNISDMVTTGNTSLREAISRFSGLRHDLKALRHGSYRQLLLTHQQFVFMRELDDECIIVAINASKEPAPVQFDVPFRNTHRLVDKLNRNEVHPIMNGKVNIHSLWPCWAHIMKAE